MKIKPEKMWAVWNKDVGLYVDTAFTRRDMIERHVSSLGHTWDYHKKQGDRVIRVLVKPIIKRRKK